MNRGRQRAQWRTRFQQRIGRGQPNSLPVQTRKVGSVQLRVNELVLRGFPKSSAHRIAAEFERELTSLLQARTLPPAWRESVAIDGVRTAPLRLRSLTDARGAGEQLARAIFALQPGAQPETGR
jgi:hypothetical protein